MNIAIDANEANIESRVGTGQYTAEILTRLHASSRHSYSLLLKSPPLPHLPDQKNNWQYKILKPSRAWTRFALPAHLFTRTNYDVFFSPAHYLPPITRSPSVVTVHDLAYEYFPSLFFKSDLYKLRAWTRRAVKKATRVIAVSQATKNDLIKIYEVPESKITVVHNGYNATLFNQKNIVSKNTLTTYRLKPQNYILFLGTLQPRKNVIKLVQAFRLLKEGGYKGKLVLAGKVGWLAEDTLDVIKNSPDHKDIVMTGYVSESARQSLYAHADVYVLPSLYEGFGVPVLEAMASGCPVVASNNSSLPEVVGKAGLLFNPSDPADIMRAILEVRQDREKYIKRGHKHVKNFSWDKCAIETLKVLTSAKLR